MACPHCQATIEVPRARIGPGTTIGGFRILKLIGAGGMGEVYLARQLSLDRDVALKIFPPQLVADKERVARFLQEVRLLARLEHPNIVTAHEAGEDDGVLFMAMAYVNGEPLDALILREGFVPESRALAIVKKVAEALAYAWNEHKLLHRDIKPSNILLDARGEPKLADLGLSRRADLQSGDTTEEEILGTPNYMSPEQVEGRQEIDCRSDMYSLGATLYHMLTGRLPFHANTVNETLQKQLTETLPDPRIFQPNISEACVHLLEIMLAKDPDQRHPTWEALIADIERVQAGRLPARTALNRGASVLAREHDEQSLVAARRLYIKASELEKLRHHTATARKRDASPAPILLWVLLIGVGIAAGAFLYRQLKVVPPHAPSGPMVETTFPNETGRPQPPATDELLRREWKEILAMNELRPDDFGPLISRLRAFLGQAEGHELRKEAEGLLAEVRRRRADAIRRHLTELIEEARRLAEAGRIEDAIRLLEDDRGRFAAETAKERKEEAESYRARLTQQQAERAAAAERLAREIRDSLCMAVLRQDPAALRAAAERIAALEDPDVRDRLTALATEAAGVIRLNEVILESFRRDINRSIPILRPNGVEQWEVRGVVGDRIQVRRPLATGFIERELTMDELAPAERLRRLGPDDDRRADLRRGVLAAILGRPDIAKLHLEKSQSPFGAELRDFLDRSAALQRKSSARDVLARATALARISLNDTAPEEAARRIRRTGYPPAETAAIRAAMATYRRDYSDVDLGPEFAELISALENVHPLPREVDREVIDDALRRLQQGPPALERLNRALTVKPEGIELVLVGNPNLSNLSALSTLPLIRLNIAGCAVSDLKPLKGLPLRSIDASGCPLSSLEGLEGAPLRVANFERCPIESLTPLRGAPLTELNIRRTRVRSLSGLEGAPLTRLLADDASLESLDPLAGAPLEELSVARNTRIKSVAALAGMPLQRLILTDTQIQDLTPLSGLRLTELSLTGCLGVRDLGPLKGMPLTTLRISSTRVSSVAPLAGMRLRHLEAGDLPSLEDLTPLKGMPLGFLVLYRTGVKDLRPLEGAPLTHVDLRQTPVTDLSPLAGAPIETLFLDGCPNLSPENIRVVLGMKRLTTLTVPNPQSVRFLRRHSSLQQIGASPNDLRPLAGFFAEP